MKVVRKGNVEKTILDETLIADYISAGWKIVNKVDIKPKTIIREPVKIEKNEVIDK